MSHYQRVTRTSWVNTTIIPWQTWNVRLPVHLMLQHSFKSRKKTVGFIVYGTFYIILQYTLFFFHFWEAPKKIAHRTSLNRIFNFRGLIWRECWALTTFIWGVHMPPVVQCAICLGAFKMWTPAYPERISQWIVIVPDILDSKWW